MNQKIPTTRARSFYAAILAVQMVTNERIRQQSKKNYHPEHDDQHANGELAAAAGAYLMPELPTEVPLEGSDIWPWDGVSFKPKCRELAPETDSAIDARLRDLTKAGGLLLSEMERLIRLKQANKPATPGMH